MNTARVKPFLPVEKILPGRVCSTNTSRMIGSEKWSEINI